MRGSYEVTNRRGREIGTAGRGQICKVMGVLGRGVEPRDGLGFFVHTSYAEYESEMGAPEERMSADKFRS